MLDIAKFTLKRFAFELRYPENYLMWDRAGHLWSEVASDLGEIKIVTGQPTTTSFVCSPDTELTVELTRTSFIYHGDQIDAAKDRANRFIRHVMANLEIRHLTRIGLRQFFEQTFDSQKKADEEFSQYNVTSLRPGRFFGIESNSIANAEVAGRISDGKNGVLARLKTETLKSQMDVPMALKDYFQEQAVEKHVVILDVDYYLEALTPSNVFDARVWLDQACRVVRRDVSSFLRGNG
ncbi:MAG: hypothetical protein IOC82_01950 [Aestuariivirga sp.]|uniref:hypothetical protein n=1 Tax=Aestuariivirga sp. TaxID=2650926 RepID=UPI0025C50E31|nr:hypothetical protein [Aestuariivirga sp.]MCA3559778.1 hypothetical protein [Aestuariivirga sp.]